MRNALALADRIHQVVVALGEVPRIHKLPALSRRLLYEVLERAELFELKLLVLVKIECLDELFSHLDHLVKFFRVSEHAIVVAEHAGLLLGCCVLDQVVVAVLSGHEDSSLSQEG